MYQATFERGGFIFDAPAVLNIDTDDEQAALLTVLAAIVEKFVKGDWDQYDACHRAKIIKAVKKDNWRRAIVAWERASGYEVAFGRVVGVAPPDPVDVKATVLTQCVVSTKELEGDE